MKIAILSDIHGNDLALRAVLQEIDKLNVDKILLLGDYVGYYYNVNVLFSLIDGYDKELIKGNHEILLQQTLYDNEMSAEIQKKYGSGIEYAKKNLSNKQIDYLVNLPEKKKIKIDGLSILMCHGSPWDICEYIYPNPSAKVKQKFMEYDADFIFIGHTHRPFVFEQDNKVLMNVGSVGQNRVIGGVASWGFLDTANKMHLIKETYYDIKKLIEQVKTIDPAHKYLIDVLKREA